MRIEAYTQVQQLYQSQKLSRTQKTKTATHTDRLQISSQGKDFQTAKAAVAAAPDIREELTAPIKARIQNGTYGVDNASFAEKLLQKQEVMLRPQISLHPVILLIGYLNLTLIFTGSGRIILTVHQCLIALLA